MSESTRDKTSESLQMEDTNFNCDHITPKKPVVIGIYGVPGSGKTFLLNQLANQLGRERFVFHDGSSLIDKVTPGGLDGFRKLQEHEKTYFRELAIEEVGKEAFSTGKVAVVAGHYMFWSEKDQSGMTVHTPKDLETYTHILYLNVPAEEVSRQRRNDNARSREPVSVVHLRKWQEAEMDGLRILCRNHGILFAVVSHASTPQSHIAALFRDFAVHDEKYNLSQALTVLEEDVIAGNGKLKTMLVIDGDKTLSTEDTGVIFWKMLFASRHLSDQADPLKTVFSSRLGYSYEAFRQVALLYEETTNDEEFDALCQDVASEVTVHYEFAELLRLVSQNDHVGAVVVTSGLRRVWEAVLEKAGLSNTVKVIGGGRISDNFIVNAAVKAAIVSYLQDEYGIYVWAFGDDPLDLGMLRKADQAIVVVGEENARSKSMEKALHYAIDKVGLRVRQTLLPKTVSPRLDMIKMPLIELSEQSIIDSIFRVRQILSAMDTTAAKLLMTPMRDANNSGPRLRNAHHHVGWYLATGLITRVVGLEEYPIAHVQGSTTIGYRLLHEQKTTIVALMRGGEPMALGVNDAFPLAMFVHVRNPRDLTPHHLQEQRTILLVDSVINSGKSVIEFVQHIRGVDPSIRIVVVAGVVQANCLRRGCFADALVSDGNLSLVALRFSYNKFTGIKQTDTGNRLFNTTHLE